MKRIFGIAVVMASPVWADDTCDVVASQAAAESGVPLPILSAITRAETRSTRGGEAGPWPWTINHAGKGEWFDTPDAALARIEALISAGESLDIGCFQLNTRWHGQAFGSASDMLDPLENARYAARYLTELYVEMGEWKTAVAAYHSRDADRGSAYAERVALIMREADTPVEPLVHEPMRENRFPLLLAGDPLGLGSLFGAAGLQTPLVGP